MNLIGMNCDLMRQYIEFVADRLLVALQQPKVCSNSWEGASSPNPVTMNIHSDYYRSIVLRTHLISWRISLLRERLISLRNVWESTRRVESCQTRRSIYSHLMQTSSRPFSVINIILCIDLVYVYVLVRSQA